MCDAGLVKTDLQFELVDCSCVLPERETVGPLVVHEDKLVVRGEVILDEAVEVWILWRLESKIVVNLVQRVDGTEPRAIAETAM